jgi:hypothetical protein
MLTIKILVYFATILAAFFFGFWELKLKRELTDGVPKLSESVSEWGVLSDLRDRLRRERLLNRLPRQARSKLMRIIGLKFFFVVLLVVEVIMFNRP